MRLRQLNLNRVEASVRLRGLKRCCAHGLERHFHELESEKSIQWASKLFRAAALSVQDVAHCAWHNSADALHCASSRWEAGEHGG